MKMANQQNAKSVEINLLENAVDWTVAGIYFH